MIRWLPYAVLAAVIVVLTQLTPTNDAAWQLWIGRQLSAGAVLYRDIIEVNPPLWFWLAVPIVETSNVFGLGGWTGLLLFLGLSAALSIALVERLNQGLITSLALIFAFFAIGLSATGQREQFTLISVTPYIFLTAVRAQRTAVPLWLAVAVGLWASLGLALKHYFVLVPLALELWLFWKRRWSLRPEFVLICAAGTLYGVSILLLTPEYLRSIVPMIGEAYASYDQPLTKLLLIDVVAISAIALLGLRFVNPRSELVQALAVSGVAFLVCFLLQQKGFRYHGLPAIGVFSIMAVTAISQINRSTIEGKTAGLIFGLVPLIALATTFNQSPRPAPERDRLCEFPRGSTILVLSPYGDLAWPTVETCDLRWASRYMFLWMLPAIERNPDSPLAVETRAALAADLARYRPDIITIQKDSPKGDALRFVMTDPGLRSALQNYRLDRSTATMVEYRRSVTP